jgi:hypothetical protein
LPLLGGGNPARALSLVATDQDSGRIDLLYSCR